MTYGMDSSQIILYQLCRYALFDSCAMGTAATSSATEALRLPDTFDVLGEPCEADAPSELHGVTVPGEPQEAVAQDGLVLEDLVLGEPHELPVWDGP